MLSINSNNYIFCKFYGVLNVNVDHNIEKNSGIVEILWSLGYNAAFMLI